jgi:ATP-dependent helicase/DNAse subunit B
MGGEFPEHRSHSQLQTWLRCQHQWYLTRVEQVPERPSLPMAAGNAVHSMLEQINHTVYKRMQDERGTVT